VADALYLQTPFTRRLERLGLRWVLTLKDNQPDLAATVERLCAGVPHGQQAVGEGQLDYWYWPQLYWPADTSVCGNGSCRWRTMSRHQPLGQQPRVGIDSAAVSVPVGAQPLAD
jgi:hypothetical protein